MENSKKPDISLIIGLTVPILMVIAVAVTIYLPSIFIKPEYNFIYTSNSHDYNDPTIEVKDNKIGYKCYQPISYDGQENIQIEEKCADSFLPNFYIYDVKDRSNRQISYTEAMAEKILSTDQSPDGYRVAGYEYEGNILSSILGGNGADHQGTYLKGHNQKNKLDLKIDGNYYDFRFIGWIEK